MTHHLRVAIYVDGKLEREVERDCAGLAHGMSTGMVNGRPRTDGQEPSGELTVTWWRATAEDTDPVPPSVTFPAVTNEDDGSTHGPEAEA